jgi:hypothetical protein
MHNYGLNRIYSSNETSIQIGRHVIAKVLARWGLQQVYNTIPKAKEWFIINYVVNVTRTTMLGFYIFKGTKIWNDYIQFCNQGHVCLCNQKNGWLHFFSKNSSFSSKGQYKMESLKQISIYSSSMAMDPMSLLRQVNKHKHSS